MLLASLRPTRCRVAKAAALAAEQPTAAGGRRRRIPRLGVLSPGSVGGTVGALAIHTDDLDWEHPLSSLVNGG